MQGKPLEMRHVREVLRLSAGGASQREIGESLNIAHSTVGDTKDRAKAAGLSWPLAPELTDDELAAALYRRTAPPGQLGRRCKPEPDWAALHLEMKRPHVTLQLLWAEYRAEHPDGYGYSRFCELYRGFEGKLAPTMRQTHLAGDRLFVDFAGATVPVIVDRHTGEVRAAQIFVAALGASSFTYVEATWGQTSADWIGAQGRALTFFGGAPRLIVPDNAKAAIAKACFYEPGPQRSYADFAAHYGIGVLPARPRKPRDKAKVESGVQIAQRWIIACLRNQRFHSLAELNAAIAPLVDRLNARRMRRLDTSRAALFEAVEKPALKPLPAEPFVYAEWKLRRVGLDYHVDIERHFYSVPFRYLREQVDVRVTERTVEIFFKGERIGVHPRSFGVGGQTTQPDHMPPNHRAFAGWTIAKLSDDAAKIGPQTALMMARICAAQPHPEQGIRAGLGMLRLARRFGAQRLEAACARGMACGLARYGSIASILDNNLDRLAAPISEDASITLSDHENIRGPGYYN
jgi:transposase